MDRGRQQQSLTQGGFDLLLVCKPHQMKYRRGKILTPISHCFLKFLETSHFLQIPGWLQGNSTPTFVLGKYGLAILSQNQVVGVLSFPDTTLIIGP